MGVMESIEQIGVLTWVRESNSVWAFPSFLMFHTLGFATMAGISAMIDLRILGFGRGIPLASLERLLPLAYVGLVVAAITGGTLALVDATTRLLNPVLLTKMVLLGLALWTTHMIRHQVLSDPQVDQKSLPPNARTLAAVSLFLWLAVVTAGRLIGYTLGT